jgi:hypothetical protein
MESIVTISTTVTSAPNVRRDRAKHGLAARWALCYLFGGIRR